MKSGLPQYIEPLRLAESGESLSGSLQTKTLPRLSRLLLDRGGAVEFRLTFSKDDRGVVQVRGTYTTELTVACQRCLEPLPLKLAQPIEFELAGEGAAAAPLEDGDGPEQAADGSLHLASCIEDEVLLGMPMVPRHEPAHCPKAVATDASSARVSPFAALKDFHPEKT